MREEGEDAAETLSGSGASGVRLWGVHALSSGIMGLEKQGLGLSENPSFFKESA